MFLPWFVAIRALTSSRSAVAAAALFGFAVGAARVHLVGGPFFAVADVPWLAEALTTLWIAGLHALAAALAALLAGRSPIAAWWGAALSVAWLDSAVASPAFLPVPYLTLAYASADSSLAELARFGGPCAVALASVLPSAAATLPGRARTVAAAGCLMMVVAANGSPRSGPATPARILIVQALSGPSAIARISHPTGLLLLPETAIYDGPNLVEDESTIGLESFRRRLSDVSFRGNVAAGIYCIDPGDEDAWWNSIYVYQGDGATSLRDKRIPTPGGESDPFAPIPLLGSLSSKAMLIEGRLNPPRSRDEFVTIDGMRVATAVCFEHGLLTPMDAWGLRGSQVDLAVCLGSVDYLGAAAETEFQFSQRGRCLHAAALQCPIIYSNDKLVLVTYPDGRTVRRDFGSSTYHRIEVEIPARGSRGFRFSTNFDNLAPFLASVWLCVVAAWGLLAGPTVPTPLRDVSM